MSAVMRTLVVALFAGVAGCGDPTSGLTIDCGPLDAEQCRERGAQARAFVADNWPDTAARRIAFTDDSGAYHVTFSDGSQGWVGQ